MDYVYICRDGDNEELRYSIRSVVKNLPEGRVWLLGGKPDWYSGDYVYIGNEGRKFNNIINCIKWIPDIEDISDDFVLMNDDFYALKKMKKVPTLHGGSLNEKIETYLDLGSSSTYITMLSKTYRALVRRGFKDPIDYDIHVPMVMNKNKLALLGRDTNFPRSMYGNLNNIGGKMITDVKTYSRGPLVPRSIDFRAKGLDFLSTEDVSFLDALPMLEQMFPEKTVYENDR